MLQQSSDRRELWIFFAVLAATSGAFYGLLLFAPGTAERWLHSPLPLMFMWCPAAAALTARLLTRRNARGLGWSWGGLRFYGIAYAVPLACGLPAYSLIWWSGLGDFDPTRLYELQDKVGLPAGAAGTAAAVLYLLAAAPLGMISTLGEEIGWRGFLVPSLARRFDLRRTGLIVGVIWSLWHYPLIFLVVPTLLPDLPIWLGTVCFTVMVVAASGIYTWLRMRSGSAFPAALLHATSNSFLFGLDRLTQHHTPYFSHEYGIPLAVAIPLVSWPFWRRLAAADTSDQRAGAPQEAQSGQSPSRSSSST